MNKQFEVLDSAVINNFSFVEQSFVNRDGTIFMLQPNGKVNFFDPFGEKQITVLKDLQED